MPLRPGPIASSRHLSTQLLAVFFSWHCLTFVTLRADEAPGFHVRTFAIQNAHVITAPGQVIEKGHVVVRLGRIMAVGPTAEIPADADLIDGQGLTVYAGFLDAAATTLLDNYQPTPIEGRSVETSKYALAGMRSDDHSGLTPEYSVAEHLKLTATDLDRYRQAGFVAVNVQPGGRIASGLGAVVNLATVPPREAVLASPVFSTFSLGERSRNQYPSTKMGAFAHLRQTFLDAERHARQLRLFSDGVTGIDRPAADSVLDAFNDIRNAKVRTLFLASTRDEHERVLNLAAEHQLRIRIWGGEEAYRLTDRLKSTETDVVLHVDFGDEPRLDPPKPGEDPYPDLPEPLKVREQKRAEWKKRVAGLADLQRAKVRFALSSRDGKSPGDLLKSMRQAVANGLDREAALAALTTDAAAILGLEKELGTIAVGRPAYLIAMTGPFDHEQAKVRHVVINGHRYEYNKNAKPVESTKPGEPSPLQVAGHWTIEIESADGKLSGDLELIQTDKVLSGRFRSPQGEGRLTSGTATKDGIEFVVSIGTGDAAIQLKFDTVGWTPPTQPVIAPPGETANPKPAAAAPYLTELRGNLKSTFSALTKWSAKRVESKSSGIQLTGIEAVESTAAKPSVEPASALSPANATSPGLLIEQPVEFPDDRKARPIVTGGNVLIQNGTVLTATGLTLPNTSVLVKNGKIAGIGPGLSPEPGMMVINATDRYVMPGIIDTHSHIMIANGINEATASIVCEVRVRDVVDTADASEYRALAGGVTTARLLHGSANCIGGQDAVVQLKHGTTAGEHLFPGAHSGVKFALGENVKQWGGRFPNTRLGVEATLNRAFLEALDYRRGWLAYEQARQQAGGAADKLLPPRRDLRLEALSDILNHQKFIHSHCYRADEILMLLRVAENHGIRVWSLQHVLEGYKVAPEIVKHGASCSTFADWWAYKMEAFDAVPHNAALLHEAGANAVIKSDDWELVRHLYAEAAKTIRYGNMPPDAALQAITLNPAKELGLADKIGSLEVGKQADIAIFSGHPLNACARCEQTLIAGEVYFTREKQPTAMSAAGAMASSKPRELTIPQPEKRIPRIDLDPASAGRFAIVGATVHPIDAEDLVGGVVLVEGNKITAVGQNIPVPAGYSTVRADGLHVYPGMVDAGSSVGLIEIAMVRATDDLSEAGQFQADLRAGIALNPDSELIPVARSGGITTTLCLPAGGGNMTSHQRAHGAIITGQTSLIQLAGWTMPDLVLKMEAGLQILWPGGSNRKNAIDELKRHIKDARLYDKARNLEADAKSGSPAMLIDPRYEALRPYLRGEKPVFIEADSRQELVEALQFTEQEKLKVVLCGATDGWKVADRIKAGGVSVIVGPVMRRPLEAYDPFDAPYANAGRLHEAGIKLCFRSETASNSRNLPFEAAMAVSYGLPEKEALRAITLSTAEILGAGDQLGSITPGKQANLVISDGSLLQPTTQIKGVIIQGKPYQPENRQTRFYEKYRARLTQK